MVKHIILWTLKEEFSGEEKETIKQGIKEGLEGLSGQIPGLLEISVRTDCLPSSTVDVMPVSYTHLPHQRIREQKNCLYFMTRQTMRTMPKTH